MQGLKYGARNGYRGTVDVRVDKSEGRGLDGWGGGALTLKGTFFSLALFGQVMLIARCTLWIGARHGPFANLSTRTRIREAR